VLSVEGPCTFFPNVFAAVRSQDPAATTGVFFSWDGLEEILKPARFLNQSRFYDENDDEVAEAAALFIRTEKPKLTFAYLGAFSSAPLVFSCVVFLAYGNVTHTIANPLLTRQGKWTRSRMTTDSARSTMTASAPPTVRLASCWMRSRMPERWTPPWSLW
jgi:hypothetical protein